MEDKPQTDSIRFSQVLAGALAAITAAVLGSTMGVAGTVIGAGLASMVTTVGGALYLRSIQRTKQGVQSVRNLVVARAGSNSVTLIETEPQGGSTPAPEPAKADGTDEADEASETSETGETGETAPDDESEQPPARRKLRWPALVAAGVLAFLLGMMVVTGVEWLRGEPLSGGDGTTVGGIVRSQPDGGGDRDDAPPATTESTTPSTGQSTVSVTETPPTSGNTEPADPPSESGTPSTTVPDTTTGGTPTGSVAPPQSGQPG